MLARMPADMGPSSPLGFVTHGVVFEEGVAVKRFRSWLHGDERPHGEEPSREWQALNLLACPSGVYPLRWPHIADYGRLQGVLVERNDPRRLSGSVCLLVGS